MRKFLLAVTVLIITAFFNAKAQQPSLSSTGSVKGVLKDTVHNYVVKSATVSVYRADSSLVNYQLSNNYGEFSFKNLPFDNKLYIEISYIGYQLFRQNFTVPRGTDVLDLKTLILKPADIMLKGVEIRVPPISMNGDTLEFNAAAFKLDSNAVVEDLLRKIPNVTLWGDGQITVNGREVKSLLVNGKEFFGGDFRMATQNISKNSLEKVQVYNTQKDEKNPLDSSLTVNLKLKKGKDFGHFGKIGGGYGINERFETDGNLNFFTPKLQLGIIGASNNINKIANSIGTLTANSTFKGTGINVEYQPDFRTTGISQTNVGGTTFSYNFIEKPTYNNKKTLTANYFVQNRNNDYISDTRTTTSIAAGSKIFDNNYGTNSTVSTNHNLDSRYELGKQKYQFTITQNLSVNAGETNNQTLRNAANQQNVLTSTNNTLAQNNYNNKAFSFSTNYNYNNYINFRQKIQSFTARYSLNVSENDSERTDLTTFRSFVNATANRDFNRKYNTSGRNINQQFTVDLPELKKLFFGDRRFENFGFGISNDLILTNLKNNYQAGDFDSLSNKYNDNIYISNNLRTNTVQEIPGLTLSRTFYKGLSNRFYKNLSIRVSAKQKLIYQDNNSDKSVRNIRRNYSNFAPTASISYSENQYGEYNNQVSLSFNTDVRIPTIDQLAPLTDSTNLYSLQKGNINLTEAINRNIQLSLYHTDQRGKNTLNYNLSANAIFTEDAFVDSTFIDNQNKRIYYLTNANGYKSLNVNGSVRKAVKLKTSALQIALNGSVSSSKNPGYINSVFGFSKNLNTNADLSFNYTYKGKLAMEARENFNFYSSKQNTFKTRYNGTNTGTTFSGSYNVTSKFTLNSNISINRTKSSGSKSISYNIWNASSIYRFLKGNNAEFKFSALDLLHQNNSIVNLGNANSFTTGTRNVLQQYFMVTVSYYPRQFGKNAATK